MKRFFCLVLAILSAACLLGCQSASSNPVAFYYSRSPALYQYFEEDGVIHSEIRDLTGHRGDLRYTVGLYLAGPMDEGLVLPFTRSTRLLSAQMKDRGITIELSEHPDFMSDTDFSLSCACLTMTCLQEFPCDSVTITAGKRSVTMTSDSITLFDSLPPQETTGG